ncbi:coagulation factor IX-like [Topomyia yanbarensis]|uniref:coagulation factor IX-like n=1 Tax=Topomyia yanbarensis TaxID=2498891 RepID=UPI00273BB924|nr:coagulation factor IX-like [Topomyia yanbarensis]
MFLRSIIIFAALWGMSSSAPNSRIFGGQRVEPGELPYTVLIRLTRQHDLGERLFCGTILTRQWILTAAHPVQNDVYRPDAFEVMAGKYDLWSTEYNEQSRSVREVIRHPKHTSLVIGLHDVALLMLATPLEFTEAVQPIAVDISTEYPDGVGTVTGYGTRLEDGKQTSFLMKLSVNILTIGACTNGHKFWNPSIICTDPGTCEGDSGAPLVQWRSNRWVQIGLMSFGEQCTFYGVPTYYTYVSQYVSWINETLVTAKIEATDGAVRLGAGMWLTVIGSVVFVLSAQLNTKIHAVFI